MRRWLLVLGLLACGGQDAEAAIDGKSIMEEDIVAACERSCHAGGYETGTWCDPGESGARLAICVCHRVGEEPTCR